MRSASFLSIVGLLLLTGCGQPIRALDDQPSDDLDYRFSYAIHNGRDCFMMDNCGYRIEVHTDGTLLQYDDDGEVLASAPFSEEDSVALQTILERSDFFSLPHVLPEIPEDEIPRGGRTILLTYVQGTPAMQHEVVAYMDAELSVPIPSSFHELNDAVQSFLLEKAETN